MAPIGLGFDNHNASLTPKNGGGVDLRPTNSQAKSEQPTQAKEKSPSLVHSERPLKNSSPAVKKPAEFHNVLSKRLEPAKPEAKPVEHEEIETESRTDEVSEERPPTGVVLETSAPTRPLMPMAVKPASVGKATEALDHRTAWMQFLHQMKEKLGVSSEKILKAFQSLTVDELKMPPEQNIAKMVAALGLNPQQAAVAQQLFKQLVSKTGFTAEGVTQKQTPNAAALSADKDVRQTPAEQQSTRKLDQKYFSKVQEQKQTRDTKDAAAMGIDVTASEPEVSEAPAPTANSPLLAATPAAAARAAVTAPAAANVAQAAPKAHLTPETKAKELAGKASHWMNTDGGSAAQAPTAPVAMAPKFVSKAAMAAIPTAEAGPTSTTAAAATFSSPVAPMAVMPKPIFGGHDKGTDGSDDGSDDMTSEGEDTTMAGTFGEVHGKGEFMAEKSDSNLAVQGPPTMAAHEILDQAHVMIKDGGGEMRVILAPEGLGEVAMKVSVNGGKVNVQMVTESDEAKRILENSFQSLKQGLSAHQLNLEGVKVDSLASISKQLDQQLQDQQRQGARQFLEQFHQENQQRRQSYFDIPGADMYTSVPKFPMSSTAQRAKPASASRRLDLVA